MIDLVPAHLEEIQRILAEHIPDHEVRAFGSRATWTAKDYSDLDLAVVGTGFLGASLLARLRESFEESALPIRVDVVDWESLTDGFRQTIDGDCVVLQAAATSRDCRETTLSNCAIINDSTYSPKEQWPFINYLDTGNITENRIDQFQHLVNGQDKIPSRARRKVQPGDIVYSTVRPNQRHFGILKEVPENFLASTGFAVIRGRGDIAETDYLYYFLSQDHIVEHLHTIAEHSTSAYPSIKPSDIASLEISLPSLDEQRRIAHILGTLDDKIELNRRMSQTLEAMAQAIFKSWFVDFDPVRAKAEGRPTGLPPELDALFPDSFQDSELGKIPSGWEVATLGDICHKPQYGYTQSAQSEPVGPKFLRITDINKQPWIEWDSVPHCEITPDDIKKYRLHHGDILIARMADPGHGCMIEDEPNAVFASYLIRFRPIHERYARYLQYWLRSEEYWELVRGRRTGTTRANLNAKALSGFPLVVPPDPVLEEFATQVDELRARVVANAAESHSLSIQRNTFLSVSIGV